jgi:hypothetical protein
MMAATVLHEAVTGYMLGVETIPNNVSIHVRMYADSKTMPLPPARMVRKKDRGRLWVPFMAAFTRAFPMFDFVDVGERFGVEIKVSGEF